MLYLLCFLCPPLAVLLAGRPLSALLNVVLTLCFYVPGVIHAMLVVGDVKAATRNKELVRALETRANQPFVIVSGDAPPAIAQPVGYQKNNKSASAVARVLILCLFVVVVWRTIHKATAPTEPKPDTGVTSAQPQPAPLPQPTPQPAAQPSPATAETTAQPKSVSELTPVVVPPSAPPELPQRVDLQQLAKTRAEWPAEVTLLKPVSFPAISRGKEIGTMEFPRGTTVKLVEVLGDTLRVFRGETTATVSADATDLAQRVLSQRRR